ncbi:hypothetical protein [Alkalilacustris brevis]|uniref:hypothetical protein n=1 Tax=Alkalilacustris brevis TaxID=2026338 RepID=UPI000E0D9923|nr:hypothetical protein [Alkalilacustris brevis]
MDEHPNIHKRRIRLLYSLRDVQLALSAADFLRECDPDAKIGKIELRRYKCYETTAILAYARPFSDSRGGFPKLSLKMIDVRLDDQSQVLHDKILDLRNRVIAHSDAAMMRLAVRFRELHIGNGQTMAHIETAFDEGLDFVGFGSVTKMLTLFHTVYDGIFSKIQEDARNNPGKYDFRHDYLDPDCH